MQTILHKPGRVIMALAIGIPVLGGERTHAQAWRNLYNQQYRQWREEFNQGYRQWRQDVNEYGPYFESALATTTLVCVKNNWANAVKIEFRSEDAARRLVIP